MQSLPGNAFAVQESSSLRPLIEAVFRNRRMWLLLVLSVILLTVLYTELTPKEYRSEMDILVQNNRGEYQITPQRTTGAMMVNGVTEEQINSEIQLLSSRSLANIVVDPQWNSQSPMHMSPEQMKAHDKAIEQFTKHLSADLVRKSNVIHVAYTASDPRTAQQMLDRLLTAFLAKQREIAQPPGTSQFFASEAARYKQELDQAQQQLAEFQQKQQIVSLSDTEQAVDRQINDAQTELRSTDAQITEESQRISTQTSQLKGIPSRQATQQRTIPNDYSVERLNTMLAELQNKRTTLLTKFTSEDPLVQEVDRQIADTKSALANAQKMTSQEQSSDVNPVWQSVTGSIIQNQTERQALKARHVALEQQIDHLKASLANTEGSTVAYTTLRQKVTDLENNYQLYTQKRDEAQMADAMNEDRLLNVAVAQSPTFAMTPFRPKPLVDMVLGSFTAMFLASFMVFFVEMGRSTIATPREVEGLSRYPLLATVPLDLNRRGVPTKKSSRTGAISMIIPAHDASEGDESFSPAFMRFGKEPRAS